MKRLIFALLLLVPPVGGFAQSLTATGTFSYNNGADQFSRSYASTWNPSSNSWATGVSSNRLAVTFTATTSPQFISLKSSGLSNSTEVIVFSQGPSNSIILFGVDGVNFPNQLEGQDWAKTGLVGSNFWYEVGTIATNVSGGVTNIYNSVNFTLDALPN